jgi:hypothetical protein
MKALWSQKQAAPPAKFLLRRPSERSEGEGWVDGWREMVSKIMVDGLAKSPHLKK